MLIEMNITQLIENKLSFEEYFLLFCVKHSHKEILLSYVKNVKSYDDEVFEKLKSQEFLDYTQNSEGLIVFSSLKLGDKSVSLFPISDQTFEGCFAELKQTYPKKFGERILHLDNARCIDLYKKIIINNGIINMVKHNLILKCIRVEIDKRTRTGQMKFMQALPTYLYQKNWEPYIDEINNNSTEEDIDAI